MKMNVYSFYDSCAQLFLDPLYCDKDEVAIRNFSYAMTKFEQYAFSSKDYDLYKIGSFDTESGIFENCDHVLLDHGANYYKKGDSNDF